MRYVKDMVPITEHIADVGANRTLAGDHEVD
jgi:hypothetical protein